MSAKLWTEEQFNCPVCLDLPNDPVTIPCGHSYCMACIKDYWSKNDPKGVYSCPQCRKSFSPKPSLSRNTMLAEAVEQLRKGAQIADVRASMRSGTGVASSKTKRKLSSSAVLCDMCKGEQRAAVKSCLVCMSSFCEDHLKPHKTKKSLSKHELIAPTSNLAEKICTEHKYLQEFFCRQCKMFVCWLCTSNQHKGHECVSTKVERLEKQKLMSEMQTENTQRLKEREQELKDMKKMMEVTKRSSDMVHDDTEQVLSELQRSVERLQELLEEVLDQASMQKMGQAQEVTDSLEAEVKELRKRDKEMKDLLRCEDHIYYLETCESLCNPLESGDLPTVVVNPEASFEPVRDAILDLRDKIEDICNQELGKITKQVNDTTLFTLGDANRSGHKGGIFKLFSGLASRNTNSRSPAPTVGARADRRGVGIGLRNQDVRSRDTPRDKGNTSSPRPRDRQRREERETVRETNPRPSPTPSPTPSRRESQSLWSRSSQSQAAAPVQTPTRIPSTPTPAPAPSPAPSPAPAPAASNGGSGFSRMASISSLFRSHRRGTTAATPITPENNTNAWGMSALSETPTEINPGLFLDSPTDTMTQAPAFPGLREINLDSIQAPEPRTREEFLQYSMTLTLDTNTAHRRLSLSEGNTKATLQGAAQPYPNTPQRFDGWTQVMCEVPLYSQRCYWEVEWRGRGSSIGVAYKAMIRKGLDSRSGLGYNAQSWTLELSDTCCSAMHDNQKKDIPVTYSPRLGIYLDLSTGTLAFYSVAESMTHLHTFRANFTQPLYAVFGVGSGVGVGLDFALGQFSSSSDSIKICPM
ncbi:E3 ubiquitin/ISG15 ligase TRIM25 [Gymnodraco acuticeps]|uniref:E3 ubiquitin/ISG15 ligase TRIM25 n=1 Tax=Gymnodraco acuticeps TaxID=8218 RepID=A0A6P8T1U8_GYMAC|nr:E3 ubiquitin/ISG15 ligase TRIM25 [Gymnodraco acuticeps]